MNYIALLVPILLGYIVGSINFSVVVTKYIGKIDIRQKGSGNAGGTNVARVMGAKWGITVIVVEILKCILVGLFAKYIYPVDPLSLGELGPVISGSIAVLFCLFGNIFPIFHRFKGGKGVTTCGAVMAVLDYRVFIVLVSLFLIVFFISKMVSLGSIIASLGMPVSVALIYSGKPYWWVLLVVVSIMTGSLILKHSVNIKRIINGTENKFNLRKKKSN